MTFHVSRILKDFWKDLSIIIEENYSQYYDEDDLIILADHSSSISEIKELYKNYKKVIIYQTEPLVDGHWWPKEYIIDRLKYADEVWDYDLDNIQILKSYGIGAKFRPFTYTEKLKRIDYNPNPDIDILFYGTINQRRFDILSRLCNRCNNQLSIVILNGVEEKKLDDFIFRTKIVLNINAHDFDRQKQTRIIYPLMNNRCVVSEKSQTNYFGTNIIEMDFSTDDFINQIWQIIKCEHWRWYEHCSESYRNFSHEFKQLYVN